MISIYTMTHKDFIPPENPIYIPLHVGRALCNEAEAAGAKSSKGIMRFPGDDTGDNISERNDTFSELTGHYFVWKNDNDSDILGICHYRRYLISEKTENLLSAGEIRSLLDEYDIITTKRLLLNFPYEYAFSQNHKPLYLKETGNVIRDLYPKDHEVFLRLVNEPHTYFGNMLIAKRTVFEGYSEWLFDILFELDRRIVIDEPDSYHRRIYGFVSEFLLYLYVVSRGLKAKGLMVGMTSEKTEVTEIKKFLKEFFEKGDYVGAREYFLLQKKKRPDITMEASDITGELHLAMQVIATAGLEDNEYGDHILNHERDFDRLMKIFGTLNRYTTLRLNGMPDPKEEGFIRENNITPVAVNVAETIAPHRDRGKMVHGMVHGDA